MKKLFAMMLVVAAAFAMPALASEGEGAKKHAKAESFKGTVTAVDEAAKTFTVKNDAGQEMQFTMSDDAKYKVTADEMVTVHYHDADGKNVATSVVKSKGSGKHMDKPAPEAPPSK